jgi:hypothetical protein
MYETYQRIADGDLLPGQEPERPQEILARVMPDWERVLPSPEPVTRSQIAAEVKRAKDPDHARRKAAAMAELGPPAPMPGLTDAAPEEDAMTPPPTQEPPPTEPAAEEPA